MSLDLTVYAIPAFIGLMFAEGAVTTARGLAGYERRDTLASLAMGVGNVIIDLFMKGVHFALLASLAPLAIFDIAGEVSFQLRAYLKILFAKFEFEITPPITLFEFSIEFDREPILATERSDGSLLLNIGPNSSSRLHGNIDDIAETIYVKQDGDDLLVWSDQFGVPESAAQRYSGESIEALGGEFGDTIIIMESVTVPVFLQGGSGDDTITSGGSGGGELYGDVGDA